MKKRQILWAILFGSMLAITGCGDDGGGSGSGGSGSGGSGSGGSNGGPSNSTCEAICSSSCVLSGVDPDLGFDQCVAGCAPAFDDSCGAEADTFLACMEANNCDPDSTQCQNEAIAWGACLSGVNFP